MNQSYEFLRPIVTGWLGKIDLAKRHKKPFSDVAEQCMQFYCGAMSFMWEDKYRQKFMGGKVSPRFKISMNKAFELVALFGPTLYHKNPIRTVKPRRPIEFGPEVFGDLNDPMAAMIFQQAQAMQDQKSKVDRVRAELYSAYLNYTPNEQPGGGLQQHAEDAITEALIKGRGTLWVEPYTMPASDRILTGAFYETVDHLLVDPDCENASLDDAQWVAKECIHPYWEVEREYGLPEGILKGKGRLQSATSQGESEADDLRNMRRAQGQSHDLIRYYKIWSKGGIGTRMTGSTGEHLGRAFDSVVGDYCYIVVAPDVPFPLNAYTENVVNASDDEVKAMFQWPIPYWIDRRWPVTVIDFYRKPRGAWPVAPMAPGLGELTFLNVVISHLCNRIWSSSRDLITVAKSASADLKSWLEKGEDLCVIPISDVQGDIRKVVQFLQQPATNFDVWKIIDAVMQLFDKRTGLSELLYGLNAGGVQSRSATDAQTKAEKISIRPEFMAGRVEKAMTEVAILEKFCTRWFVEGQDVAPLVGPVGAFLWDKLITTQDPEVVIREMEVTVEAGSARKPNKDRDIANVGQIFGPLLAELSKHADMTTDTGPLNALIKQYGDAIDQDVGGILMGARMPPPPPPEMLAQAQAAQGAEQQKIAAEQIGREQELVFDEQRHQQEMRQDEERHKLDMRLLKARNTQQAKKPEAKKSA